MFRIYMHALRLTRLQTKIGKLQTPQKTPTDRPVLPTPTHRLDVPTPHLLEPPYSATVFHRTPKTLPPAVDDTRKHRV